MHYEQFTLKTT